MQTQIIIKFQYEALHCWPLAPSPVFYLRDVHRHQFHITCSKVVEHDDRAIEIITFKKQVVEHLHKTFNGNFNNMSCEHIAKHLLKAFQLESCEVLEDGENGAIVSRNAQDDVQQEKQISSL